MNKIPLPKKRSTIGSVASLKSDTGSLAKSGEYKPEDVLKVMNRDDRFAYRWLSVKKLEAAGYRDGRGWEIVRTGSASGELSANDKNPLDSTVRTGDLILARMPREKADARNAYYRRKNDARIEILNQKDKFANKGVRGEFKQQRGKEIIEENY